MSLACVLTTLLVVAHLDVAHAQDAPPPTPAATQTTVVHGTPPDLTGRWLVFFDVAEKAIHRSVASFLEIRSTTDGRPEISERFVDLPAELKADLDEHNQARELWTPTAADLAVLAERWDTLPPADRGVSQVTFDLWEASALGDAERQDPTVEGAIWVLRETIGFTPGGQRPSTQVNIYGARARDGTGWRGSSVLAQVVAAPFPVPITLNGTFRMLRVEATAGPTGLVARLFDAFKGCR